MCSIETHFLSYKPKVGLGLMPKLMARLDLGPWAVGPSDYGGQWGYGAVGS